MSKVYNGEKLFFNGDYFENDFEFSIKTGVIAWISQVEQKIGKVHIPEDDTEGIKADIENLKNKIEELKSSAKKFDSVIQQIVEYMNKAEKDNKNISDSLKLTYLNYVVSACEYNIDKNKSSDILSFSEFKKSGIYDVYSYGDKSYSVYIQGENSPWSSMPYSEGDYNSSACGATALATAISGFKNGITPDDVGKVLYNKVGSPNGSKDTNVTNPETIEAGLHHYGLNGKFEYYSGDSTKEKIMENLEQGNPVIINLRDSKIGKEQYSGHYVTLLGINSDGQIMLGDSYNNATNSGYYDVDEIFGGLNNGQCEVCCVS